MQRIEFRAMGCQMLALLDCDSPAGTEQLAQVPEWFAGWEQQLSRFREESELSRLNRGADKPVRVSPVLWQVLRTAVQAAEQSAGLVVPTLLDALEATGYDRSFEAVLKSNGNPQKQTEAAKHREWRTIKMNHRAHTVQLPAGMRLDFGGIAKGWAADQTARRLAKYGDALIDAGGDIAVRKKNLATSPWPISIADPFNQDEEIGLLLVDNGGIATSGRDYRRWQSGGVWQHHIIDPRTGKPAQTDVLSATVVAPSAREAEVAAKVAFIEGSRAGLQWLEERPAFAGLLVLEDQRILYSSRIKKYLWSD